MNLKNRQSAALEVAVPELSVRSRLRANVKKPSELSETDRSHMYLLMREYYAGITEARFLKDLSEKDDVIVLRDDSNQIRGFSTLLVKSVTADRGPVRTVFSGDTVVDREFWGQKELGIAFLKYLFVQKLKQPMRPLYWMLMSKGYKTYLLMANNFRTHYPRYEQNTPREIQSIMDRFYGGKFGEAYNSTTGLITIVEAECKLREGVAAVTDELRTRHPRVDFFARVNPNWDKGVELACIAEMTLYMPLYYLVKKTVLRLFR